MALFRSNWTFNKSAFALVEVLLAFMLFGLFSLSIFYLSITTLDSDQRVEVDREALRYAQEGIEASRQIRDQNFYNLTTATHGLSRASGVWAFAGASESIDNYFTRTIEVEDVYRDGSGNIAASGTVDPAIKKVTAHVTWLWKSVFPKSVELTTYLTDWTDEEWVNTTCNTFNQGTPIDSEIVSTIGPPADNCAIDLALIVDEGGIYGAADAGAHGNDVIVDGNYAYVPTHKMQEGLSIVDVTDPESPFVVDRVDIGGPGSYVDKVGDYVYVSVDSSSKGLAIVDVSDPEDAEFVRNVNVGGKGNQVDVVGTTLYMGVGKTSNSFVVYNVANVNSPVSLGTYNFSKEVKSVLVDSGKAYVGLADSVGFRILNVSNPASMTQLGSLSTTVNVNAIQLEGDFAYLALATATNPFWVVNVSVPATPTKLAMVDLADQISDLSIYGDFAYAAMPNNQADLAVIDITAPAAPSLLYTTDMGGKATGVFATEDAVYLAINVGNSGLAVGGTAGYSYAPSGEYVSPVLDTGSASTRYDSVEWANASVPGTNIFLQIKTASSAAGLSSATWVGNDGTSATYYEVTPSLVVLDPARTGTRYFQYRLILYGSEVATPSVETVTIHYHP